MSFANTSRRYGGLARAFHWLTALLILVAWPLGWWAEGLPFGTAEELALKADAFSWHKTLGVAAFFVAILRVIWALTQPHPDPLHPEKRLETWVAVFVHWMLYGAILLVPLSGWIHHAATEGFAPILWPFGQSLPFVPLSEAIAHAAGLVHFLSTKVIFVAVALHVAGALKHAILDRDLTLARMLTGAEAGTPAAPSRGAGVLAAVVWLAVMLPAIAIIAKPAEVPQVAAPVAVVGGNWAVEAGDLSISVRQMGSNVAGRFTDWAAEITFDPQAAAGNAVKVDIDVASLQLGSVSAQATGKEFLNAPEHPTATFTADIRPKGDEWVAEGYLDLAGHNVPLSLPFTLDIQGDRATMQGGLTLDRRDFGVGAAYADEGTVGFAVEVKIALTAVRK